MKCVPPDGRFIPTITGRPAATCARIHAGDGPNTITNGCPGIDSAALSISPRPVNHPACPAIETGVTPENPKCEYTIARSEMRQPIFQTGIVPTTGADAHRLSRWLKYAPHVSPATCGSRISRSVEPAPLPAPARPRAMSQPGHVIDGRSSGADPHACTPPLRSSTHPPGEPAGAAVHATSESAMSRPRHKTDGEMSGAPPNG